MLSSVKLLSSNLSLNFVSRWVCQQTKRGPNCFTRVLGLVWAMREAKSLKLHRMSSMVNGRRAAQTGGLTSITQLPIRFKIFCVRISFLILLEVVTKVPHSTRDEMEAAVESAKNAFKTWSRTTPLARQQIMFRYVRIMKQSNIDGSCLQIPAADQGQPERGCQADHHWAGEDPGRRWGRCHEGAAGKYTNGIQKGLWAWILQVVENLCANTSLMLGETLTGISKDMDLTSYRVPLGVCAGIAPFNFPAMIPLWMFPTGDIEQIIQMMEIL